MQHRFPSSRPPILAYVLGTIAVLYSAKFLIMVVPQWFVPVTYQSAARFAIDWLTHISYAGSKLGLAVGLVSLFRFPRRSFAIYGVCWAIGLLHTVLYYSTGFLLGLNGNAGTWYISQHLIPHIFYPLMLVLLRDTRRANDY